MRIFGGVLVATAIVVSTAAALWTYRLEVLPQLDGTTFRYNRFTGEMQLCDARRCIDASAKPKPPAQSAEDRLFKQILEETSAQMRQELQEKSDRRRSTKGGIEKAFDLVLSGGAGALTPFFETGNLLFGDTPFERKSKFRIAAEHGLIELERQSFWNAVAGTVGSILSGAAVASILAIITWKILIAFGFMRPSFRSLLERMKVAALPGRIK